MFMKIKVSRWGYNVVFINIQTREREIIAEDVILSIANHIIRKKESLL
jgi:hypothetical protein